MENEYVVFGMLMAVSIPFYYLHTVTELVSMALDPQCCCFTSS